MKSGGQIGDLTESCPSNARFTQSRVVIVMFIVVVYVVVVADVFVDVVDVFVVVVGMFFCCWCHFTLLPPRSFEKKDQLKNLSEILHKTLATNFTGTWIAKKLVKDLREAFTNSYAQRSTIAIVNFSVYLDNSLLLFVDARSSHV